MPKTLPTTDRSNLIRLASTMPVGSEGRKAILAKFKTAGISYRGVVVNGADKHGGLHFSREAHSQGDFEALVEEALRTDQVVEVTATFHGAR